MKALLFLILVAPLSAQSKYVVLSPKSNLDTATVAEGFQKSCPNVVVTENKEKADYVLETAVKTTYSDGDSYSHWHFTLLSKDGDVLFTTHPEWRLRHKFQHHFEAVCGFINGKPH